MYRKPSPAILISSLPVGHVDLRAGEKPMLVCQSCGQWVILTRKIAHWHTDRATGTECAGGGQLYCFDISPAQVAAARTVAVRDAEQRRTRRTFTKPQPPKGAPLTAIARRYAQAVEINATADAKARAALARLERALA